LNPVDLHTWSPQIVAEIFSKELGLDGNQLYAIMYFMLYKASEMDIFEASYFMVKQYFEGVPLHNVPFVVFWIMNHFLEEY